MIICTLFYVLLDVTTVNGLKLHNTHNSSSNGFIEVDPLDKCDLAGNHYICSAVIPSLPMAINWLRECARENPSIRFQVILKQNIVYSAHGNEEEIYLYAPEGDIEFPMPLNCVYAL